MKKLDVHIEMENGDVFDVQTKTSDYMLYEETAKRHKWGGLADNPAKWEAFLAWSALATAGYAGLFTFLASSSFVFIKVLGLTRTQYGLVLFTMAFAYMLGTVLCRRLLLRFGVRRSVALAAVLTLTGGTVMGVLALAGVHSAWAIMLPYYLFMLAHGVHQPCGQSGAVGPVRTSAG